MDYRWLSVDKIGEYLEIKRDHLVDALKQQMKQKTTTTPIFTIR